MIKALLLIIDDLNKMSVFLLSIGSFIIILEQSGICPKLRCRGLSNTYVYVIGLVMFQILHIAG